MKWEIPLTILMVLCAIVLVSGCTDSSSSKQYSDDKVSFSYPGEWNITDKSSGGELLLVIDGKTIMVGELFQDNQSTATEYKDEVWSEWTWNQSTINGNTVYQGFSNGSSSNTDSSLGYYKAIFVKGNQTYYLQIHGTKSVIEDGYKQIVNSFKIK